MSMITSREKWHHIFQMVARRQNGGFLELKNLWWCGTIPLDWWPKQYFDLDIKEPNLSNENFVWVCGRWPCVWMWESDITFQPRATIYLQYICRLSYVQFFIRDVCSPHQYSTKNPFMLFSWMWLLLWCFIGNIYQRQLFGIQHIL